jgi:hypothetical protein
VPLTGQRLWSRLSRMSWDEIETRLGQEVSKRLDVALCKFGFEPGRNGLNRGSSSPGNFFFSKEELPGRLQLLRQHMPQQEASIIAEADAIRDHQFRLLGFRDVSYGKDIDWHLDAVHGKRSPLIPWYKINFLNFDEVGDHKITWELNRHQHLVTLAKAWALTGNQEYADEIFAQWYSWQQGNPYPLGANWASSLEVAFRSLSWIWVDHLLVDCPAIPPGFRNDLLRALALNGRHIERYLSTYFSPNTHLLGEAVALFFLGMLYPQISAAEKWKQNGWRIVLEESRRQVRPDGVYFEQTLYYHVYALDFFLHARLLASRNAVAIPAEFDLVLQQMLAFVDALSQNAAPDGFGDDDGGRLFDAARNRAEHLTDPLAAGAAILRDHKSATEITEEAIWLVGEHAIPGAERRREPVREASVTFPDGGVFIIRSSDPVPQQMTIDAGPQGTGHSGHGHADALSIKLSVRNRRWLVDAGTFCYIGPGNDRNIFRGTRAHNTLAVDGLDQAVPEGPFGWSNVPIAQCDRFVSAPSFSFFAGSHSGYERLAHPVCHRRFVFHPHGGFWFVRDIAEGTGVHQLEISWHFAPDVEVSRRENHFVAMIAPIAEHAADEQLILLPTENPEWSSEVRSEYVSPVYGEKVSAPVVRCSTQATLPAEFAVMLTATSKSTDAGILQKIVRDNGASAPAVIYRFEDGSAAHYLIFRRAQKTEWTFGLVSSDAAFIYLKVESRRIREIFFCDGSYLRFSGKSLFSLDRPLQWMQWIDKDREARDGSVEIVSADDVLKATSAVDFRNLEFAIENFT